MNATVKDLMSPSVITIQASATVDRTRRLLQRNGIGSVPVVDAEGHPVGIISSSDLNCETERQLTDPVHHDRKGLYRSRVRRCECGRPDHAQPRDSPCGGYARTEDRGDHQFLRPPETRFVEDHRFAAKNAPTPSRRNAKKDRMTRSGKETTCRVGPGER